MFTNNNLQNNSKDSSEDIMSWGSPLPGTVELPKTKTKLDFLDDDIFEQDKNISLVEKNKIEIKSPNFILSSSSEESNLNKKLDNNDNLTSSVIVDNSYKNDNNNILLDRNNEIELDNDRSLENSNIDVINTLNKTDTKYTENNKTNFENSNIQNDNNFKSKNNLFFDESEDNDLFIIKKNSNLLENQNNDLDKNNISMIKDSIENSDNFKSDVYAYQCINSLEELKSNNNILINNSKEYDETYNIVTSEPDSIVNSDKNISFKNVPKDILNILKNDYKIEEIIKKEKIFSNEFKLSLDNLNSLENINSYFENYENYGLVKYLILKDIINKNLNNIMTEFDKNDSKMTNFDKNLNYIMTEFDKKNFEMSGFDKNLSGMTGFDKSVSEMTGFDGLHKVESIKNNNEEIFPNNTQEVPLNTYNNNIPLQCNKDTTIYSSNNIVSFSSIFDNFLNSVNFKEGNFYQIEKSKDEFLIRKFILSQKRQILLICLFYKRNKINLEYFEKIFKNKFCKFIFKNLKREDYDIIKKEIENELKSDNRKVQEGYENEDKNENITNGYVSDESENVMDRYDDVHKNDTILKNTQELSYDTMQNDTTINNDKISIDNTDKEKISIDNNKTFELNNSETKIKFDPIFENNLFSESADVNYINYYNNSESIEFLAEADSKPFIDSSTKERNKEVFNDSSNLNDISRNSSSNFNDISRNSSVMESIKKLKISETKGDDKINNTNLNNTKDELSFDDNLKSNIIPDFLKSNSSEEIIDKNNRRINKTNDLSSEEQKVDYKNLISENNNHDNNENLSFDNVIYKNINHNINNKDLDNSNSFISSDDNIKFSPNFSNNSKNLFDDSESFTFESSEKEIFKKEENIKDLRSIESNNENQADNNVYLNFKEHNKLENEELNDLQRGLIEEKIILNKNTFENEEKNKSILESTKSENSNNQIKDKDIITLSEKLKEDFVNSGHEENQVIEENNKTNSDDLDKNFLLLTSNNNEEFNIHTENNNSILNQNIFFEENNEDSLYKNNSYAKSTMNLENNEEPSLYNKNFSKSFADIFSLEGKEVNNNIDVSSYVEESKDEKNILQSMESKPSVLSSIFGIFKRKPEVVNTPEPNIMIERMNRPKTAEMKVPNKERIVSHNIYANKKAGDKCEIPGFKPVKKQQ